MSPAHPLADSQSVATLSSQQPSQGGSEQNRVDILEDRLARIELQLQQVLALTSAALTSAALSNSNNNNKAGSTSTPTTGSEECQSVTAVQDGCRSRSRTRDVDAWLRPKDGYPPLCASSAELNEADMDGSDVDVVRASAPRLPPLDEILLVIDEYFAHSNSVIPLFSQMAFMRMHVERLVFTLTGSLTA
ncbi:hypothetical protein B0T17DRAFT_379010 [Bombardia bombarda]|uniref:Uncharacterized protein n=1 Tax=Bombardia bombarda TaxID=252184 RepID=A0AA39WGU9_9PEZI|nr:hypothetical protein B0T17DRAFT_379010 [Bombardia bombarda]